MKHLYLREESYYQDIFDHVIVDACREIEQEIHSRPPEYIIGRNSKRLVTSNIDQFLTTREAAVLWVQREKRVRHMMEKDKLRDELLANIPSPTEVRCVVCENTMRLSYKVIKNIYNERLEDHVLFVFHCQNCERFQGVYDTWEMFLPKGERCLSCEKFMEALYIHKPNDILHVSRFCRHCHYHDTKEVSISSERREIDTEFEADKKRFCFSKEKAEKQYAWFQDLYDDLLRIFQKSDEKKKQKPLYDKVAAVKRPNIGELKKYLSEELKKYGYSGLEFEKPDISKGIWVNFTVMDETGESDKYKITKAFRARLKSLLANTVWEMGNSERLQNRLGILSGQLRGIDNEDEIFQRTKNEMERNGEKIRL